MVGLVVGGADGDVDESFTGGMYPDSGRSTVLLVHCSRPFKKRDDVY